MNKYIPLLAQGMSVSDIAKHFHCTGPNVVASLKRDNLPTTPGAYLALMYKRGFAPSPYKVLEAIK